MTVSHRQIAEIIPLVKMPRGINFFDYEIPEKLRPQIRPGSFVKIPFKDRIISGLVRGLKDSSLFDKIRPLEGLNEAFADFPDWRLELLDWFSNYYHYSLPSSLRLFVSEPPKSKRRYSLVESAPKSAMDKKNAKITALAKQVLEKKKEKKFLLFPCQIELERLLYQELCRLVVAQNKQIAILFPQKFKLTEFFQSLSCELRKSAVILYAESSFSKNEYFKIWQAIQNNEIKIILGTRSAVFAPFANLEMLIVSDSHSEDYKQYDQNPRYEAVNVALKVQELINCRLILSSLTPRLEDAHLAKKEKFLSMTLGKSDFPGIKIVNLTEERKERFTYLSDKLINCLKEKIKNGERSLLIVNRRGEFTYCFCADCGFEAVCPECGLPYSIVGEKLVCFRCRNEIPFFSNCPKCKGANFKKIGAGINKIKTDLEAGLGVQVENVETKKPITETNVYLSSGKNLSQKAFDKIGFLGFVYADGLVHLTDFNSDFKLFGFLQELIGRVRAGNSKAEIIVQTRFPENIAFNSLNKGYGEFYRGEMKVREDFGYPPFYTILKCIFQHHDEAVAKREAASLFEKLKNKVEQAQGRITEPYLHYTKRVRRRFRIQIVIFIPSAGAEQIEKELAEEIPDYWIIDKNPIDLL